MKTLRSFQFAPVLALPGRAFARVSLWVQGGLIGVLLFAGFRSWSIQKWTPEMIARLPEFGAWAPPVWFIAGDGRLTSVPRVLVVWVHRVTYGPNVCSGPKCAAEPVQYGL